MEKVPVIIADIVRSESEIFFCSPGTKRLHMSFDERESSITLDPAAYLNVVIVLPRSIEVMHVHDIITAHQYLHHKFMNDIMDHFICRRHASKQSRIPKHVPSRLRMCAR